MELISILYPRKCPVCETIIPDIPGKVAPRVCLTCNQKLQYIHSPRCFQCGKQLYEEKEEFCNDCKVKKHLFKQGIGVFGYDENIKDAIYRFKYHNQRNYAKFFGEVIASRYGYQIRHWNPDVIIPIPLYRIKYYQRGFNQAELVAKELGNILQIPVDTKSLVRNRKTKPMKELNDEERTKNLQNAFNLTADIVKYKKVLLLDDIYTTGATMDACSKVLLEAGVEEIYCASVCIGNGF